jgi:hypothetical protein
VAQMSGDRPLQVAASGPPEAAVAEREDPAVDGVRPSKPLRYAKRYGSPDAATRLGRCNQPSDPLDVAGDRPDAR